MKISEQGISLIKKFEGFSATPYLCPAGKWTIGYGHVISSPHMGEGISEEQAEQLLLEDLASAEAAITRLVKVPLSQNQFDALCSLIYNIGIGAFARSTLLRLLNNPPPLRGRAGWGVEQVGKLQENNLHPSPQPSPSRGEGVSAQFNRWVYGGGKTLPGLVARRKAEVELFKKNSA